MVLIVDDRPENIIPLKKILENYGFIIDVANSGEEVLRKVLRHDYSLIILDVQMPDMDGFEVAEALSGYTKTKDVPIIFLSAVNKDKTFVMKGYDAGAVDYITKPVDPDVLLLKVKTFYKLSEQKRQLSQMKDALLKEVESRKAAENLLDLRLQELQASLNSLGQIAFTLTLDGVPEFVNEQWFKYSADANSWPEEHPDDKIVYKELKKALRKGEVFEKEIKLKKLNCQTYNYFLLKVTPILKKDSIIKWVGTFTNIHQQKEANEILNARVNERTKELTQKNEELELKNHELQQFAWVASHDLKEPLRKIRLFSGLIKDNYPNDGNIEVKNFIEHNIKSVERASTLINDLLDYSRLSKSINFVETNLNEVIIEVLSDLEYLISEKNAVIKVAPLPVIQVGRTLIRQLIQNLISNALKFNRKGVSPILKITGQTVTECNFESKPDANGNYCRIVFSDNGIGFNNKYLDKIFVIFQRLHSKEEYDGTGIGLAIAKKIIERHNGIITAKSIEGKGTDFIIVLPLHQNNI